MGALLCDKDPPVTVEKDDLTPKRRPSSPQSYTVAGPSLTMFTNMQQYFLHKSNSVASPPKFYSLYL